MLVHVHVLVHILYPVNEQLNVSQFCAEGIDCVCVYNILMNTLICTYMCGLSCAETMATVSDPPTRALCSGSCAYS